MIRVSCLFKYWRYPAGSCKCRSLSIITRTNRDDFCQSKPFSQKSWSSAVSGTTAANLYQVQALKTSFGDSFYIENRRTFSTSSVSPSIRDKLGSYYVLRDEMRLKRRDFYKRFSAARFVKAVPESWQPYLYLARVDKPIGTWLLYLPCAFSICLATPLGSLPDFYYLGLFGVGAFLMRGAGCVINDLWDKDLDKHVTRTKDRPLASGKITPKNAVKLLAVQLSLSLGILLSLNMTCILIGVASMIPVVLYPYAKRITNYPQAVLGVTFNIGAIMGYVAVTDTVHWQTVLPLYFGCFLWTMYYDTVYALQDAEDDARIGIKSTALLLYKKTPHEELMKMPFFDRRDKLIKEEAKTHAILASVYLSAIVFWMAAAVSQGVAFPTYLFAFVLAARAMDFNFKTTDVRVCHEKFVENRDNGLLFLLGIILGIYI